MTQPFTVQALAPWLWLLDRESGGTALDASGTEGRLAAELSGHFSDIEVIEHAPWITDVPWSPHTFDCIALHESLSVVAASAVERVAALRRVRDLMRPGGWLAAASANSSFLGNRGAPRAGIAPRLFAQYLTTSGFTDVRRIYVTPSLEQPRTLIPDARRAVTGYEAFEPNTVSRARGAFAQLGIHSALYPAYFILARA
jgi:hypothetical protein